jgi:hypothetical protein
MMICLCIVQSFRALHYKKVPLQQIQREFRKISVPQVSLLCCAPDRIADTAFKVQMLNASCPTKQAGISSSYCPSSANKGWLLPMQNPWFGQQPLYLLKMLTLILNPKLL